MRVRRRALVGLATSAAFERAAGRVPGVRERAWRSARRYVAGDTSAAGIALARRLAAAGLGTSLDLFGERTPAAAARRCRRRFRG